MTDAVTHDQPPSSSAAPVGIDVDVRLTRVTKRFDHVVAVDDVTLAVERGRFLALLGPSGCGKTTSLRMIRGFERPDEGVIYLGEQEVSGLPPFKRDVNTTSSSRTSMPVQR